VDETSATLTPTEVTPDGRASRAARTREAIVDALLTLNDRGDPQPSARDIAAEAGVALRTVYVHFDDVETLILAAADRQRTRLEALLPALVDEGPFSVRFDAFWARRATMHEVGGPVRQAALLREPRSPAMQRVMRRSRKLLRAEIAHCFAPEIDAAGDLGSQLLCGLDVVASSNTWDALRSHQALGVDDATDKVRAMALALVHAWTPPDALGALTLDRGGPT
jgi:TetR/AcrR family transcriptional regulator, regulator of autoinduction and epiphytic fitness